MYTKTKTKTLDCPCENKHKLEKIEKKHINEYAKIYGNKILNKRGNDEIKEKPEIKYSFKIEKEDELKRRIEKMLSIKNNEKNKEFQIQFRNGEKKIKVTKRYGQISLTEAMDFTKQRIMSLKQQLISQHKGYDHYLVFCQVESQLQNTFMIITKHRTHKRFPLLTTLMFDFFTPQGFYFMVLQN